MSRRISGRNATGSTLVPMSKTAYCSQFDNLPPAERHIVSLQSLSSCLRGFLLRYLRCVDAENQMVHIFNAIEQAFQSR